MSLIYIIMEKEPDATGRWPVAACFYLETAERMLKEKRAAYPDSVFTLYQCPYEQ